MEADDQKLIHELEVHQIELEMQYEELKAKEFVVEIAHEKYTLISSKSSTTKKP